MATGELQARGRSLGKIGQQWLKIEFRRGGAANQPPLGILQGEVVQAPAEGGRSAPAAGWGLKPHLPGEAHQAQTQRLPQLALAVSHSSCQLWSVEVTQAFRLCAATGEAVGNGWACSLGQGPRPPSRVGKDTRPQNEQQQASNQASGERQATGTNRTAGFQCSGFGMGQGFLCSGPARAPGIGCQSVCVAQRAQESHRPQVVAGAEGPRRRESPSEVNGLQAGRHIHLVHHPRCLNRTGRCPFSPSIRR